MVNLMSFLSSLASYLLVFAVFTCAIIVAFFIGSAIRKNKNKSEEAMQTESEAASSK